MSHQTNPLRMERCLLYIRSIFASIAVAAAVVNPGAPFFFSFPFLLNNIFFTNCTLSTFNCVRSKIVLIFLLAKLNASKFKLFDVQFMTPHLASMGAIEIQGGSWKST